MFKEIKLNQSRQVGDGAKSASLFNIVGATGSGGGGSSSAGGGSSSSGQVLNPATGNPTWIGGQYFCTNRSCTNPVGQPGDSRVQAGFHCSLGCRISSFFRP